MVDLFATLSTKEFILLIGFFSTIINVGTLIFLKNEELEHNVTQEKLKQLYSKEIEVYEELYTLSLKYHQQKFSIGRENLELEDFIETEHSLHTEVIRTIFNYINKNLFYISNILEKKFRNLSDKYLKVFKDYKDFDKENPKPEPLLTEIGEDEKYGFSVANKKKELLDTAQKKFYSENKKEIIELLDLIKKEFKEKKNYK